MKLDLMMIDYGCGGFKRYAVSIVRELKRRAPQITIGAFYMSEQATGDALEGFDLSESLTKYDWNAQRVFDTYQPKAIVVFGHRIFDYMFTIEAHRRNIIVFNFQHGLYMEHTVISELSTESLAISLKKKRDKVWQYMKCLHYMGGSGLLHTLKTVLLFLKLRSLYAVVNVQYGDLCHAEYSFVYGDYWKEYYAKQFMENGTEFVVVGYPELEQATEPVPHNAFSITNKPVLCYLAQTTVEDGLIEEKLMQEFLAKLGELTETFNLVMKYHPRSNRGMYQCLYKSAQQGCVIDWDNPNFPMADAYIGHESTIIARAIDLTDKTIVCRLTKARVSPFEEYTSYVATETSELAKIVNAAMGDHPLKGRKDLSEYVFHNKQEGSIVRTVDKILRIMRDKSETL